MVRIAEIGALRAKVLLASVLLASGLLATVIAGCGGDARQQRAHDAVLLASTAIDEARTSGGEDPGIAEVIDRSQHWLEQSEQGVELWRSSGSFAYETAAPCLARSLDDIRDALLAAGRRVPDSLDEAQAAILDEGTTACAERRAPAE